MEAAVLVIFVWLAEPRLQRKGRRGKLSIIGQSCGGGEQ